MNPRRIRNIVPSIRDRITRHPQSNIQRDTIRASLEILPGSRQIVPAKDIRRMNVNHIEGRFLSLHPGFGAIQRRDLRSHVADSAVVERRLDFRQAVVGAVRLAIWACESAQGDYGDGGGGDDDAGDGAGFPGGFEDAPSALHGGLHEVGVDVVAQSGFDGDRRGDVDDVFGAFGGFVEGAGDEEVGDYGEGEIGEIGSGFEDGVGFEDACFLFAADCGADVVACFEGGAEDSET